MKVIVKSLSTISIFLLFTTGFAAGAESAQDYFPLNPGTTWTFSSGGSTHVHSILSGAWTINGVPTKARNSTEGMTEYFSNDSQGIRQHRYSEPGWEETYSPPIKIANASIVVGGSVSGSGDITVNDSGPGGIGVFVIPYDSVFTVVRKEDVTVPAGTFSAYKLSGTITIGPVIVGGIYIHSQLVQTYWSAKGMGVVKYIHTDPDGSVTAIMTATNLDDDGDSVPDTIDNCPGDSNTDQLDTDSNGQGDACDLDDDGDGVLDGADAFPLDSNEWSDNDNDGVGDNSDLDDDNDGVLDAADLFPLDPSEWSDYDSDGAGDNADLDDDNDGVNDIIDRCRVGMMGWTSDNANDNDGDGCRDSDEDLDDDNDGVDDAVDAFPLNPNEWSDYDSDGAGNNADPDDDNDGVEDVSDSCSLGATGWISDNVTDNDGDGCRDSDEDLDDDNDGVDDGVDAFPLNPNESVDTDGDGIGNNAETDDDNDGIDDVSDSCPQGVINWVPNNATDNDSDGCRDSDEDLDDDNDGMSDLCEETYGFDSLNSADAALDKDNDSMSNLEECQEGTDPTDGVCPVWYCGGARSWRHAIPLIN